MANWSASACCGRRPTRAAWSMLVGSPSAASCAFLAANAALVRSEITYDFGGWKSGGEGRLRNRDLLRDAP